MSLPTDIELLGEAIQSHDVGLVILDPILSVIDGKVDDGKTRELRRALEPINRLAGELSCAFVGIAHFNKRQTDDTALKLAGLSVWRQVARLTLVMIEDPDNPNGGFVLSNDKNNLGRKGIASLKGQLVGQMVDTEEGPTSSVRVEWLGESTLHVKDILAMANGKIESTNASDQWLTQFLTVEGRTPSATVKAAGRLAGFADRTLERALGRIGGLSTSEGFRGKGGKAFWSLPTQSDSRASASGHARPDDTVEYDDFDDNDENGRQSANSPSSSNATCDSESRAGTREADENEPDSRGGANAPAPTHESDDDPPRRKPRGTRRTIRKVKAKELDFSETPDE